MPDILTLVDGFDPEQQATALQVLDAVSRPLTVREIEAMLRKGGLSRSRAVKVAGCVKNYSIIAVIGPEDRDNG